MGQHDDVDNAIYIQFLYFVEKVMKKKPCCEFNKCDFKPVVRKGVDECGDCARFMVITWRRCDECGFERCKKITLNITGVCLSDLKCATFLKTLYGEALCFVEEICQKPFEPIDIPKSPKPVRKWCPVETKITTTYYVDEKEECDEEPQIIHKREKLPCDRPLAKKEKFLVYKSCEKPKRGQPSYECVVEKYEKLRGETDFNHPKFKSCCSNHKASVSKNCKC